MEIIEKLDALGEYQAQADLLALKKQELLDAVKIPAEVLAAQDDANKRRQAVDSAFYAMQKEIRATEQALLDEVVEPEMPPEFVAALAAARAERDDIRSQAMSRMETEQKRATEAKAKVDADLQAKVADVYAMVAVRKAEIAAEFDDKASGVLDNIAKLTAEIKRDVARVGQSIRGKFYQAVYVKGRVTWNTERLDSMMALIPQLGEARKEGEPSVSIRKV